MLQPKKTKYRKQQKVKIEALRKEDQVSFGEFGLKATTRGRLTDDKLKQLEER